MIPLGKIDSDLSRRPLAVPPCPRPGVEMLHKEQPEERNTPPNNTIMGYSNIEPLFPLGEILTSPGVIGLGIDLNRLLRRHQSGDWGDICPDDIAANEQALTYGEAILSQYPITTSMGSTSIVIVMSEDDRSHTVVLLAGDPALLPAG